MTSSRFFPSRLFYAEFNSFQKAKARNRDDVKIEYPSRTH
jgi:hypothetical protein